MPIQQMVIETFQEQYANAPDMVVRAPGRVNLIGEHTDYNDGFVLPMAIDRAVYLALRRVDTPDVSVHLMDFEQNVAFSLDDITEAREDEGNVSPATYIKGVAWALQEAGYTLRGFEGVLKGNVPVGAGLSSSAALELTIARAFAAVSDINWHAAEMATLCQKAENQYVGVNSGIMDQMISAAGEAGHALLIDCRSLETVALPLPDGTAVAILDTGTRRELADSEYNARRQQCETAAQFFDVPALRDVSIERFEAMADGLDKTVMRRARHVITENNRVQQAKQAMQQGDKRALGKLLNDSHASLRDDYDVSSEALNTIVKAARAHPATYGARMTGAGFGGCAVALIDASQADNLEVFVAERYSERTPHTPSVYICQPSEGANMLEISDNV
jgi:galactokinase